MRPEADGTSGSDDPTLLFEEVLAQRERGEPLDWKQLEHRAGKRSGELRERLLLMRQFEDLAFLLTGDPKDDEESTPSTARLDKIGRYVVGELLGEGGLSRVYRAHDEVLGREVALKLLSPTAVPIEEARAWMISEGRSLAKLEHESIVRVFDVDEHQGFALIAMEPIEGASLFETIEAARALKQDGDGSGHSQVAIETARKLTKLTDRCRLVARLARALDYCHSNGIVHRDVKPGNVLIDLEGVPKLIDFGLSHSEGDESSLRITQRLAGTVAYFSPEQVDQGRSGASPASDQFSLGVILYELLTFRHPFATSTHAGTMAGISRALPKAPRKLDGSIPADLERVCLHALERVPADRYASLGALADDLEAFLGHRAISVQPPSPIKLSRLWLRRHRKGVVLVGGGLFAAFLIWLGGGIWKRVALQREISTKLEGLRETESVGGYEALFGWIRNEWIRAREYDSALLSGSGLPTVSDDLDGLWSEASERFHAEVDPLYIAVAAKTKLDRRESGYRDLHAKWDTALDLELASSPHGLDHDHPIHYPGRVVLPEGGTLLRQYRSSLPSFPILEHIEDREHLEQAAYRYKGTDANGNSTECEFRVFLLEPRWELTPVTLDPSYAAELAVVDEQHVASPFDDAEGYTVDSFEISKRPVTWRDVHRVFDEDELRAHIKTLHDASDGDGDQLTDPDSPAPLTWTQAQVFLHRVGGRLPTPAELYCAQREGFVTAPESTVFIGEWASSHYGTQDIDRYMYRYPNRDSNSELPPLSSGSQLVSERRPDSISAEVCFRIARSL